MRSFAARVVAWQRKHGRRDLPWQGTRDPYRVWLSEIMLQQTQVATVLPYYARFLERFPDVDALAAAPLADVMRLWAGLGYYTRARNLHACARAVVADFGGRFPAAASALAQLPGIGRSTAAAIAAFCFGERVPILDGNVKRVLARHFVIGEPVGAAATERKLWALAHDLLPARAEAMPAYTQGLMDLGATVCTRNGPRCADCPLRTSCVAARDDRVDELPAPRARKAAPLRRAHFLVAVHGDRVLLEERPPIGIWGGLYALPQFGTLAELNSALRTFDPRIRAQPLPARKHAFTHFTLVYTPHLVRLERAPSAAHESKRRWVTLRELDAVALPTPVAKLLLEVREHGGRATSHAGHGRNSAVAATAAPKRRRAVA
jgi:A/G-specific adenine glycosylase